MNSSLTTKFNFLTIAVILITAISIGSLMVYREATTKSEELRQRGLITAAMLARASEYGVYTENLDALKKVVRSARMDPDFAYATVLNADNGSLIRDAIDPASESVVTQASGLDRFLEALCFRRSCFQKAGSATSIFVSKLHRVHAQICLPIPISRRRQER
jgi:sensor histidine kinase regulating citrate/malate metabolism